MKKRFVALLLTALLLCSLVGCCLIPQQGQEEPATELEKVTPVSAIEMTTIQNYLNNWENNGFVGSLNFYDAPEEVSLETVLYDGAGIGEWVSDWDEAELQTLLTTAGWDELYVGVIKFPAAAVEQLVQEKLGISMTDLEKPFEYIYLEEYDAYYHMHSDTNYMEVTVTDALRATGDVYHVQYRTAYDDTLYEVTLLKVPDGYRFVSNKEK